MELSLFTNFYHASLGRKGGTGILTVILQHKNFNMNYTANFAVVFITLIIMLRISHK